MKQPTLKAIDIPLPVMHRAQAGIERGCARFNLFCCGRRFGKDVLLERRLIRRIVDGRPQGWFAPSYRMMEENYKAVYNRIAPLVKSSSASAHQMTLVSGATIDFFSLDNYDSARGRKYAWVSINEAASTPYLLDAWNFVIRPTLADWRGGADFGSTPKGLNGFYSLWAQAADDTEWTRHHYSTYDNPHIPRDEIAKLQAALPGRVYRQEILAEFLEDGSFFQGVDAAAIIDAPDKPDAHKGHDIYGGLDWALSNDFTVLTLYCRQCNRVVDWWRGNKMDFSVQLGFITDAAKRWDAQIFPERNSIGGPNIESLFQRGVKLWVWKDNMPGFPTTASTKPDLIQRLAAGLEHDGLKVPREYADELRQYEVQFTLGGHPKFSSPEGLHDDRVISLALAYQAASGGLQIF